MSNELILVINLILTYSTVLIFHKLFGKTGLYAWTVIATITANIEVQILVHAFGMEQTLGNILFASTFLVTDILSEMYGKKEADTAVNLGIAASLVFILITQSWMLYTPSANDWAYQSIQAVFKNTPRIMIASFSSTPFASALMFGCITNYGISQRKKPGMRTAFCGSEITVPHFYPSC